ncbi:Hypothetical predicted protein [Marmota monax]|uniref:Uncharacterized protein n=1 Tax=Marmota monax TaxID=9995 RepID=A0A5E4BR02_MARMO|nr:Hypothetical predicted protein [Marmota monax]
MAGLQESPINAEASSCCRAALLVEGTVATCSTAVSFRTSVFSSKAQQQPSYLVSTTGVEHWQHITAAVYVVPRLGSSWDGCRVSPQANTMQA